MATGAVEAAARGLFPRGKTQVFLPNHVITFLRPKPGQPPNLATFAVPLKFNKFDLRDYLFHVYNVEVNHIRSFINQPGPERKDRGMGKWYRPAANKMMVAELKKPFVWPEPVKPEDREKFDYESYKKLSDAKEENDRQYKLRMKGVIEERKAYPTEAHRKQLKKQAEEFLANPQSWVDVGGMRKAKEESLWREVETEDRFEEGGFEAEAAEEGQEKK
ncbi:hypothetical protein OQA88_12783 [Cercophora sp. LCS_1]